MEIETWSVEYFKRSLNKFLPHLWDSAYIGSMNALLEMANWDEDASETLCKVVNLHTALQELRKEKKNGNRLPGVGTSADAVPDHHPHDGVQVVRPARSHPSDRHSGA